MRQFAVVQRDFSGDQILVRLRDTLTGIEHVRGVTDVMRSSVIDELSPEDVAYIKALRKEQDGV
jgi:hypothetical protein